MFNFLKRSFHYRGLIQFDENNKPTIYGCNIKWLDKIKIKAFTEKNANKQAFKYLNNKYPEYKNHIQLF